MSLTIVTYHYVRDTAVTAFPGIKALSVRDFLGQLDFLEQHYVLVAPARILATLAGGEPLPARAALLTFDDGFVDHCETVAPILTERGLQAFFFPAARPVSRRIVLLVHKLQFILAAVSDKPSLARRLDEWITANRTRCRLEAPDAYRARYARASRYDPPEVTYVKRTLQKELPAGPRAEIVDSWFRRFVTEDEGGFAETLYASRPQLAELIGEGMVLGSHGARHDWLDTLSSAAQAADIDESLDFLQSFGLPQRSWTMCYPYGGYDDTTLALLAERGCAAAFTVECGLAELGCDDPLALPRLDTNDLPKRADAGVNGWTRLAG
jgi:peptidoglycan/xylan/chitin deacetylase (PgdA/CDA1 family)